MKYSISTLILLFTVIICKAQIKEADKIYIQAIEKYTSTIDTFYMNSALQKHSQNIYLQKPDVVDSIPQIVNGYHIQLMTFENQRQIYKTHKGKITHTIMFPAKIIADSLVVSIIPYRGILKKGKYNLGVSDGTEVWFKFDCSQRRFVFHRVRTWGI